MTDRAPSRPSNSERLARAAQAAQALSETLWEALLHEGLADPDSRHAVELSERLTDVSAAVALLAKMNAAMPLPPEAAPAPASAPEPPVVAGEPAVTPTGPVGPARVAVETIDTPAEPAPAASEAPSVAVLVDELASAGQPAIAVKDTRGERGPAPWIDAIGRRLERYERDGLAFAVLLVELVDIERLRHAELPGEVARLTGLVEAALTNDLHPADTLARESPGRYWLLASDTSADGASVLAERLADAVRDAASHRGAPLEVAIGIAVCPDNGREATVLAAHADIALYAARAAGRPVAQ